MRLKKLLCIFAAVALLFTFVFAVSADFGDFGGDSDYGSYGGYDSYDYGGNDSYDYGGSYGSGDSYDYGGSYNSGYGGGYYYGGTDTSGYGREGGDGSALLGFFVLVGLIILVCYIIHKIKASKRPKRVAGGGATATDIRTLKPVSDYLALDPEFNEAEFKEKLSNLYVKFQNSWQAKKMEDLRPYLTDAFYAQMDRQLETYRQKQQTNIVDRIAVLDVNLVGWKQEGENDVMVARLKARIVDYVVDDVSGSIVRGSDKVEKFMEYEWNLVRTKGLTTQEASGTTVQVCPNCGAHVDVNHSAQCEYCGSILTTDTFDWAVSTIKGLAQRTAQ